MQAGIPILSNRLMQRIVQCAGCLTIQTMFARRRLLWFKRMAVWQALLCLTVVAFLARAAIPAGYMPSQSGSGDHTFPMALCLGGSGITVVQVSLSDSSDPESADQPDCLYGLCIGQKLLPEHPHIEPVGAAFSHLGVPVIAHYRALPPLPALGPPLGSRAPPVYLV